MEIEDYVSKLGAQLYTHTLEAYGTMAGRHKLRVVTLTASRDIGFREALMRLAKLLEEQRSGGHFLCLDVGEDPDHLHAHGLLLDALGTWKLKSLWASVSERGRNSVRTLSPRRDHFEETLLTCCRYCLKPIASVPNMSLDERVFAGGAFEKVWKAMRSHDGSGSL